MKIAYVSTYDAANISIWSGTGYYMARCLANQAIALDYVDTVEARYPLPVAAKRLVYNRLLKQRYFSDREPAILHAYARQIAGKLSGSSADVVFSPGTLPIAYLESKRPIVFWTDATFAGMVNFYPGFHNLCQQTVRAGHAAEQSALDTCSLAIYSSEWAAQTAVDHYQTDHAKVHVVPFGANIACDRELDDIKGIVNARPTDRCKLLFLGVDWLRKGGQVALDVAVELDKAGLDTELTIVGCEPPTGSSMSGVVKPLGFVSKSTAEGAQQINTLLAESHFLILPSVADCTPIVFGEANSFGLPCLSTAVGGIPTIVKDHLNGKLFSRNAVIAEYCTYVLDLFSDYARYRELALSSFNEYTSRLNWSVAGRTVKRLLAEALASQ